jgi:hypothetical protein
MYIICVVVPFFKFFYVKLGSEWYTIQLNVQKLIRDVLGNVDLLSKAN